jgi:hypothetical protein
MSARCTGVTADAQGVAGEGVYNCLLPEARRIQWMAKPDTAPAGVSVRKCRPLSRRRCCGGLTEPEPQADAEASGGVLDGAVVGEFAGTVSHEQEAVMIGPGRFDDG